MERNKRAKLHPHISRSQNSASENNATEQVNQRSLVLTRSNCGVKANDSNTHESRVCQIQSTSEKTLIQPTSQACATDCISTSTSKNIRVQQHATARKGDIRVERKEHPIQEPEHNLKELQREETPLDCAEARASSRRSSFAPFPDLKSVDVTNELTGSSLHETEAASGSNDSSMSSTDLLYKALHDRSLYDSVSSSSIETPKQPASIQDGKIMTSGEEGRNEKQIQILRKRKRNEQITAQDQSVSSLNSNSSSSSELLANTQCNDSSSSSKELL